MNTITIKRMAMDLQIPDSDVGNHRVRAAFTTKTGNHMVIDFSHAPLIRFHNKRTGALLKKPVREDKQILCLDTNMYSDNGMCYRSIDLEKFFWDAKLPYTKDSILTVINSIAQEHYDAVIIK